MADSDNSTMPTGASGPTHDADAAPVGFHPPLRPPVSVGAPLATAAPVASFCSELTGYTGEDGG